MLSTIRARILYPFMLAMLLLILGGVVTSIYISRYQLNEHTQDLHDSLLHVQSLTQQQEAQAIAGMLDIIRDDAQLIQAWDARSREALLKRANELYRHLNGRHDITHFYFHELDRKVFLRVHQSHRFGDIVERSTLLKAVQTAKPAYGLEIGVLGSFVLRYVSPWYIDGRLVGYIELGKELDKLARKVANILDIELYMFINKELLSRENWESFHVIQQHNTGDNTIPFWEKFPDVVMTEHTSMLPARISAQINREYLHNEQVVELRDKAFGYDFYGGTIALHDINDNEVGHLLFLHDVSDIRLNNIRTASFLGLIGAALMIIIMYFLYRYLGNIENDINMSHQGLEDEIDRHKRTEVDLLRHRKELESSNAELESYSYSIAHDLRAPLRSIVGFSQIVKDEALDRLDESERQNLQRVIDAGRSMAELIDDILQLARMSRQELVISQIDLGEIAQKIFADYQLSHPQHTVNLHLQGNLVAMADKLLLDRLLFNLLENAFKYTVSVPAAEIVLGSRMEDDKHIFFVRDNGIGFDMRFVDKIFMPFQRLHVGQQYHGTGVGLAIVKRIVDRHGGMEAGCG